MSPSRRPSPPPPAEKRVSQAPMPLRLLLQGVGLCLFGLAHSEVVLAQSVQGNASSPSSPPMSVPAVQAKSPTAPFSASAQGDKAAGSAASSAEPKMAPQTAPPAKEPGKAGLVRKKGRRGLAKPGPALARPVSGAAPSYTPPVQNLVVPPPAVLPPAPPLPKDVKLVPLGADEACAIALTHQASLKVAGGALAAAHGRSVQASSALLPSVSLTMTYTEQLNAPSGPAAPSTAASAATPSLVSTSIQTSTGYLTVASARQLVWDFNHTRDLVRQARALEKAAQATTSQARNDLVLAVKQAFYVLLQARRTVLVQEENYRNRVEHLALAQSRFKAGVGLPVDVVRAQAAVSEAVLALTQAQNARSLAQVNLNIAMGLDPRTPLEVTDSHETTQQLVEVLAHEVGSLFDRALTQRPELKTAQANKAAAEHALRAAHTSNAPVLSGSFTFLTRGQQPIAKTDTTTAGASLTWTPFDSGLAHGKVLEATGNDEVAAAQMVLARQAILQDVATNYLNLKTAQQQVVTSQQEVISATEGLRLAEGRYRSGLGQFLDVLDAQAALLTAESNRVSTQAALDQAWAALKHALGDPILR